MKNKAKWKKSWKLCGTSVASTVFNRFYASVTKNDRGLEELAHNHAFVWTVYPTDNPLWTEGHSGIKDGLLTITGAAPTEKAAKAAALNVISAWPKMNRGLGATGV